VASEAGLRSCKSAGSPAVPGRRERTVMSRPRLLTVFRLLVASALVATSARPLLAESFVNFESGQVRPLALSPDGSRLFAVNTPDNRLEIFTLDAAGVTHAGSVPVGLEPVAV